jgi:hypothetical protein
MAAIVTDQFRILNVNNFIESVNDPDNAYYIFLSLPNPTRVGFGRDSEWDTNTPNPIDNLENESHVRDTMLLGRRITSDNCRRLIRKVEWSRGTRYEMYRHDYSVTNLSPVTKSSRLYDSNYYILSSNYNVYVCLDNGSSGINTTGNASLDEPLFTDLEPSRAGESGDGYVWKYLFTVPPSDIIKFDSTEYISVPNNWYTSTDPQILSIRESGDSSLNDNQIKKVYIEKEGFGYANASGREFDILGDGQNGKVVLEITSGRITDVQVSTGGKEYSYGVIDLGSISQNVTDENRAKLIPIIPPSNGHGYDVYKELGTDKVLMYARFDDSTRDFPTDTKFAQIGIIKNPTSIGSTNTFTGSTFSALNSIKFSVTSGDLSVGDVIQQSVFDGIAYGYVASYDEETRVVKYFNDRSLYYNKLVYDQTDYAGISTASKVLDFESSSNPVFSNSGFTGAIDVNFTGITTNPTGNKLIQLASEFNNGLSSAEINKKSGEIIYLDNRPLISRSSRQKEDVKIILEF